MRKLNVLNFGKSLNREEMKAINGGEYPGEGMVCGKLGLVCQDWEICCTTNWTSYFCQTGACEA